MKLAKPILIGVVLVVASFIGASYLMPRYGSAFRVTEIPAPPAAVFAVIGDLRRFNEWSPWFRNDPGTTYTFTGPIEGVGQTLNWKSDDPKVGSGSLEIKRLDPDKEVEMQIVFAGQGDARSWLMLEPKGATTKVTWGFMTDLGFNPVSRVFGINMDQRVGPDYQKGLSNLKALLEKPAAFSG